MVSTMTIINLCQYLMSLHRRFKLQHRIIFLVTFLAMSGCTSTQQQYAIQSGMVLAEANILKGQYLDITALLKDKQENDKTFTDAEWRELQNVEATIDMLVSKYDAIAKLDMAAVSIQDVQFLWGLAVTGYESARGIILAHWDELPPSTQVLMNGFDRQAMDTSVRLNELLKNPDSNSISESLTLILGTMGLAAKLIGAGVIAL